MFVESLYQETPVVQEAVDANFEPYREAVWECLDGNSVDVERDASRVEYEIKSTDLMVEGGVNCLVEAGYT